MADPVKQKLSPRSQAKRREILDVAADLFSQRGFEKTSIKALAADAQVSTSTIYTYFEDKAVLFEHVVRDRLDALLEDAGAEARPDASPLDALVSATRLVNRRVSSDPLLAQLLTYQRHVMGAGLRDYADGVVRRLDEMATDALRLAVESGDLECEDPEATSVLLRLYIQGWLLSAQRGAEKASEPRVTEAMLALLRAAGTR